MAVRNPRNFPQPCTDCPQPKPTNVVMNRPPMPQPTVTMVYSVPMDEGLRLWKHVLFGTATCIGMIEGYTLLEMPGNPLEALTQMRDRLIKLVTQHEGRKYEIAPDAEARPVLDGPTDGPQPSGE